jgi:hypothetical protein
MISESALLIICGMAVTLVSACGFAVRKSKCANVSCCGGLFQCERMPHVAGENESPDQDPAAGIMNAIFKGNKGSLDSEDSDAANKV